MREGRDWNILTPLCKCIILCVSFQMQQPLQPQQPPQPQSQTLGLQAMQPQQPLVRPSMWNQICGVLFPGRLHFFCPIRLVRIEVA